MRYNIIIAAAFIFLSFVNYQPATNTNFQKDVSVVSSTENSLKIHWQISGLTTEDFGGFTRVKFDNASYPWQHGAPLLPFRKLILGMPENANIRVKVQVEETSSRNNVILMPVATPVRGQNGVSGTELRMDTTAYMQKSPLHYEVNTGMISRNLPLAEIKFYPVRYDFNSRKLEMITRATIEIEFTDFPANAISGKTDSKSIEIHSGAVINFEQSKNWYKRKPVRSAKPATLLDGPWYGMEIKDEGLYKITYSALNSAGLNPSAIDPRTIKIYNNGGFNLNTKSSARENNPDFTQEIAIYVSGEADGSFDSGDYILFYGKGVGGWAYSASADEFKYSGHTYDTQNKYWLTFGDANGKRMSVEAQTQLSSAHTENYYIERAHFEEDLYNLLSSGPDWYGYRFFGTSNNLTKEYDLDVYTGVEETAQMVVRLKGGSGIKYDDYGSYRYCFNVYLNPAVNPAPLLYEKCFYNEDIRTYENTFPVNSYLLNGKNTVKIDYAGNEESCNSYLDWIEFYFPKSFAVSENQLLFYTLQTGKVITYPLVGFTKTDVKAFDISDPLNVTIIGDGAAVSGNQLNLKIDLSDNSKRKLIVSSLTSGAISNITDFQVYQPHENLLAVTNQAEFIVITHPTFRNYAQQLVDFRAQGTEPLSGKVVSTDDIYFYFSSGVQDVTAIRNFLKYAVNNWSQPSPAYVLLFGDGHYDYRNIALKDTNRVPPFEIFDKRELYSRESDNFYVDIDFNSANYTLFTPDMAVGRIPANSVREAENIISKLLEYNNSMVRDGWQTVLTFVADDEVGNTSSLEWLHQNQTEGLAKIPNLYKFLKRKIYLTAYNSVPGGFGRVKLEANEAILNQLQEGTLILNYVGHGSPQQWAHENVLDMTRDYNRINNKGKLPLWIAATCDFGKYDDPMDRSFTEELVVAKDFGAIGVISSSRLGWSSENVGLNENFYIRLFPDGNSSRRLGDAMWLATLNSDVNDQKYHLYGDPTMYLADPRENIKVTSFEPDTLKALSKITVSGTVQKDGQAWADFDGAATMLVNDARFDSVNTGGPNYYSLDGPRIFKGEISVEDGAFTGEFIVPKSIRYMNRKTGRFTIYAWNEQGPGDALGYVDTLLFYGTSSGLDDLSGPELDIYFRDMESFSSGDYVGAHPILVAKIYDENGINLTQEVGHTIDLIVNEQSPLNITSFFAYDRNSYREGKLEYALPELEQGEHILKIRAWDNLNNPTEQEIVFKIISDEGMVIKNVVNYPNPFSADTYFTFQALNAAGAEVSIKVYTISGRLIYTNKNEIILSDGFQKIWWDGRDNDGDEIANGIYLYKIRLKNGNHSIEKTEKLMILK